ncbi:gamma-glutamyltransferase family protein [Sphingosinicella rhizophila]|uniref:Gamma-glutamyltransferase n=1 Tax=Sphingosinicella rhizophila TaxID=3050082 RepID=A0ABU3Q6X7_9SPHN|nr:gamma-glutamyltransferase [Sphingosinicella sp. GR2756]MDT9598864.1 gamma-glutamyltransferase [Sphingosinicella sp. GR2756]
MDIGNNMGSGMRRIITSLMALLLVATGPQAASAQATAKPVLHGRHWVAITGKPLAATAGATIFAKGGNAVDAACAMLAATSTMWDVLSWGGETQALIYNPKTKKVIGINALGVAPTGATPDYYKQQGMKHPPEFGPLAAVTPGTPGGLLVMLAEYGKLSLKEVLEPAIQMADGYPIEKQTADYIEQNKERIKQWPYSRALFLTHPGRAREAPDAGEIFRQRDLAAMLRKLVAAEQQALAAGKSRKEAIQAAYDRFYRGDIAEELVRSTREQGGLFTMQDLADWRVRIEEPVQTSYRGIQVYKLREWTQGPALLQALNILEGYDLKSMGYNSARYVHTLYQAMNLAFADRDFYYGDIYAGPEEPIRGLLSKDYARSRAKLIRPDRNDPNIGPGDPYPFQRGRNPYQNLLRDWNRNRSELDARSTPPLAQAEFEKTFRSGTTTVQAADAEGWVVSITPSGGWIPAVIAGRTGVGLSQRAQSFVLDAADGPYNVIAPGKQPRVTLTPSLALKDGSPFLSFAVQGGDTQDQNLLQFFLNMVEFDMNVQQAAEAPNINSYQMRASFGEHEIQPGGLLLNEQMPPWVRSELDKMGYKLSYGRKTSGPINAIYFDREHGTFWGGSSNHGDDYGIAW